MNTYEYGRDDPSLLVRLVSCSADVCQRIVVFIVSKT